MKNNILILAACAASPALLVAEEQTSATNHTIIVTADRRDTERERNSNSVEVIDSEDAERLGHPLNVSDLMVGLPGVDVVTGNGGIDGGNVSVRLRGGRAQDTRILLDNIPLSDPLSVDGSVNGAFMPGAGLERIEIVKGAQSGLYGSNAVGGVINLLTVRPSAEHEAHVLAEGGSFATARVAGSATGPITATSGYALGVDLMSSHGFSVATGEKEVGYPSDHENDGVRRGSASGRMEWTTNESATWYVGGLAQATNQDYDDLGMPEDDGSQAHQRMWRGSSGGTVKPCRDVTVVMDAAYTGSKRVLDGTSSSLYTFSLHEQYASAHATWVINPMVDVTAGSDGIWDQGVTDTFTAGDRTVGAWGQCALHHRYADASATLRRDHNADAGGASTWRLGAAGFTERHEVKFHTNAGTGFVTPTLDQRYASYPAFPAWQDPGTSGNTELKPERSLSRDAGLTIRPFSQVDIEADVTVFRTDYHDKIVYVYGDYVNSIPSTYQNVTTGRIQGAEASLTLDDASIPVQLRLSATWQDFEDETNTLQRLLPNRKARAELGYAWTAWWFGTHVDAADRRWNLNGSSQSLPGYMVLGATVRWEVAPRTSFYVRGENLTGTRYEINHGFTYYTTMPRAAFIGVDTRF